MAYFLVALAILNCGSRETEEATPNDHVCVFCLIPAARKREGEGEGPFMKTN